MKRVFQILRWAFSKEARILSLREATTQLQRQRLIALGEYVTQSDGNTAVLCPDCYREQN